MNPTYDKPLNEVTSEKLKQLVGEKYDKVAACPLDKHNFPIGRSFALAVGYPKKELDKLPQGENGALCEEKDNSIKSDPEVLHRIFILCQISYSSNS